MIKSESSFLSTSKKIMKKHRREFVTIKIKEDIRRRVFSVVFVKNEELVRFIDVLVFLSGQDDDSEFLDRNLTWKKTDHKARPQLKDYIVFYQKNQYNVILWTDRQHSETQLAKYFPHVKFYERLKKLSNLDKVEESLHGKCYFRPTGRAKTPFGDFQCMMAEELKAIHRKFNLREICDFKYGYLLPKKKTKKTAQYEKMEVEEDSEDEGEDLESEDLKRQDDEEEEDSENEEDRKFISDESESEGSNDYDPQEDRRKRLENRQKKKAPET
jgi:hypothetical protein